MLAQPPVRLQSVHNSGVEKVKGGSMPPFTQIGAPPHKYAGTIEAGLKRVRTLMKEVRMARLVENPRQSRANGEIRISTQTFRRKNASQGLQIRYATSALGKVTHFLPRALLIAWVNSRERRGAMTNFLQPLIPTFTPWRDHIALEVR